MGVLDRIKKKEPEKPKATSALQEVSDATRQEFQTSGTMDKINPEKVELRPKEELKGGIDWQTLDYDAALKYNPDMSRGQYISDVSKYRQEKNLDPMSYNEMFLALGGKNPNLTPKEEKQRENRMKAATYVDALGGVFANLVNYIRTKNGNPAMNLSGLAKNEQRINTVRDYYTALDNSQYKQYLAMIDKERALQAEQDAAERDFRNKMFLEEYKRNSPLNLIKLEAEKERLKTEGARRENILSSTKYNLLRSEGKELENKNLPTKQAAELALIKARTEAANRSNRGNKSKKKEKTYPKVNLSGKSGKSDVYDLNKDSDVVKFYNLLEKTRGLDETQRPKNVDDMRDYIVSTMYKEYDLEAGAEYALPGTGPTLGWGKKNEEETDNETDW